MTVSFTFTGGYRGQEQAATLLADHGMAGTFYVSSGYIGRPAYLSRHDLRTIHAAGSEIGGGTVTHRDLSAISPDTVLREVCHDRATLSSWDIPVSSFAYPHGTWTYETQVAVQACGYNSARGIAELRVSDHHCAGCPSSESLPPRNPYDLKTVSPQATVAQVEAMIRVAAAEGGGWVPVALSHFCACSGEGEGGIRADHLDELVRWVAAQPFVTVRTVDEVVGGTVRPVVRAPAPPATASAAGAPTSNRDLSRMPAWVVLGQGIGQAEIIFTGLLLACLAVAAYRLTTRGRRYDR